MQENSYFNKNKVIENLLNLTNLQWVFKKLLM